MINSNKVKDLSDVFKLSRPLKSLKDTTLPPVLYQYSKRLFLRAIGALSKLECMSEHK